MAATGYSIKKKNRTESGEMIICERERFSHERTLAYVHGFVEQELPPCLNTDRMFLAERWNFS